MSEKNMQLARTLYPGPINVVASLADRELIESIRGFVHPDFVSVFPSRNIPMGPTSFESDDEARQPTAHGVEGFVRVWREWLSAWESWVATPTRFVEVDEERVLVLMHVRARSKTHQVEMPIEAANLLTIRDEKLARLELYNDQAEALEAVGLRE